MRMLAILALARDPGSGAVFQSKLGPDSLQTAMAET